MLRSRAASPVASIWVPVDVGAELRQNISRSLKLRPGLSSWPSWSIWLRMLADAGAPVCASSALWPGVTSVFCVASAASGDSAASAAARSERSCGRGAPGRGGRRLKSGGIDKGARVVTENSSGASRVKPKVRVRLSELQPASSAMPTTANPRTPGLMRRVSCGVTKAGK